MFIKLERVRQHLLDIYEIQSWEPKNIYKYTHIA